MTGIYKQRTMKEKKWKIRKKLKKLNERKKEKKKGES
jgi:hypothetical protein